MHYVKKLALNISIALIALLAFILITVVHKNNVDLEKLKAKNAELRAEILNKDKQLKSELEKLKNQNRSFSEVSTSPTTVGAVARPIQIRYRYISHHYRYRQRHRLYRHSYRHNRLETSPEVSRGDARTVDVESIIREAGSQYWANPDELDALVWISNHECTTPGRVNPHGFYGLFQLSNPPSWMVLGDAASETKAGCEYILHRYGTPLAAKAWWMRHHWY